MENRPLKQRSNHEELMIKRRDKEMRHAEAWGNTVKYYDTVDKNNAKFSDWTSPRYYKDNNKLIHDVKVKKDAEKNLEKRRERLRKLLQEDERTYEVEMMMAKAEQLSSRRKCKDDEIPDEILKDINNSLKLSDDARRRQRAEEGLYKQWRGNPVLRDCQSRENAKSVKMSWLDQQIEKRMAKEKEEEERRKLARERERFIQAQKEKEENLARDVERQRVELANSLQEQMDEIKARDDIARDLRIAEDAALANKIEAENLQAEWEKEERVRAEKETVLFNYRQHRRKLEEKSRQVKEELKRDQDFIERIKQADILERIDDEKKHQLRVSIDEFNKLITQLRDLEEKRKPHIEFTFESEAKPVYEQFNETWNKERRMREELMQEVLREIQAQIVANVQRNKAEQLKLVEEKEACLERARKYREDMDFLKEEEERKRQEYKKELDEQIKENRLAKRRLENSEKKKSSDDLESLRRQEERIKREIARIRSSGNSSQQFGRKKAFY